MVVCGWKFVVRSQKKYKQALPQKEMNCNISGRLFFKFVRVSLFCFCVFAVSGLWAQEKITTVGIEIKPIFPLAFVGTGPQDQDNGRIHFHEEISGGFSGGMVIRKGLTDLLAVESGIHYVKRRYSLDITDSSSTRNSIFRTVSYEIPFSFIVFIQLGEQLFMNASMGPGLDMFASDIQTYDDYFLHVALRHHIFQPSIQANIGWELRTEKSGYIYIGATWHRPFSYIYRSGIEYTGNKNKTYIENRLSGTYLTLDLRYYFHEEKAKKVRTTN